jgi:hypothetical protein
MDTAEGRYIGFGAIDLGFAQTKRWFDVRGRVETGEGVLTPRGEQRRLLGPDTVDLSHLRQLSAICQQPRV